jgi:hypothetical protein
MQEIVHYRALEAFCRQRAQMENEGTEFWMIEANRWALKREELFVGPLTRKSLPKEAA